MDKLTSLQSNHSAKVNMELVLADCVVPIAQMGGSFIILKSPKDYPPGNAEIVLQVDDAEDRFQVFLPDGLNSLSLKVNINHKERGNYEIQ